MRILLSLVLLCSVVGLQAKTYDCVTGNKDISCKIHTVSYKEFSSMIGDFGPYYEQVADNAFVVKDLFGNAKKHNKAFIVEIENNSDRTITVGKEYIQGIGDVHKPIEELIEIYKPYIKNQNFQVIAGSVGSAMAAFMTVFFVGFGLVAGCGIKRARGCMNEGEDMPAFLKDGSKAFQVIFCAVPACMAVLPFLFCLGFLAVAVQGGKNAAKAKNKKLLLKQLFYTVNRENNTKTFLDAEEDEFEVGPREKLSGLLLINTQRGPKDIFERITPHLRYA